VHAVVVAHCGWVIAVQSVEDTDCVGFVSLLGGGVLGATQTPRLEIRSINNQVLSCPERTSTMPAYFSDCLTYSDRALDQASQSTEPERTALIAQAQVAAIQAVALALERLRDQAAEVASVVRQSQRPR